MSTKIACITALVMVLVGLSPARGQETLPGVPMPPRSGLIVSQPEMIRAPTGLSSAQPEQIPTQPQVAPADEGVPVEGPAPAPVNGQPQGVPLPRPGLSDWITYNRNTGIPVGNQLPLMQELFIRSGTELLLPNTIVGKNLLTGWEIEGGGRLLLFNPPATAAWVAEVSILTIENFHNNQGTEFPLSVVNTGTRINFGQNGLPGLKIKSLNRTFVNLGGGREWYLLGSALAPGWKARIGVDGGGRWGSAKMEFTTFPHRTDTIGGMYAAVHGDVELPLVGACYFVTGLRAEWDYTWMDILQTKSDVMGLNIMANFGIRW